MIHLPFVASALLIPLAGYPLLYLPVHIVWVELIIHPTALLVFQELPAGRLERTRGRAGARFFTRQEWALIALVGALLSMFVIAGYVRSADDRAAVEHGRAMALAMLTLGSAALTATCKGVSVSC